jgi:hypothetical protein
MRGAGTARPNKCAFVDINIEGREKNNGVASISVEWQQARLRGPDRLILGGVLQRGVTTALTVARSLEGGRFKRARTSAGITGPGRASDSGARTLVEATF